MYSLLLAFILLASIAIFCTTTTPGLFLTLKLASYLLPGNLQVSNVNGRLLSHCSLGDFSYRDKTTTIILKNVELEWQLTELFRHRLAIEALTVDQVKFSNNSVDKTKTTMEIPRLPFEISLQKAFINQAQLTQDNTTYEIQNIKAQAKLTNQQWQIKQLNFDSGNINFATTLNAQPVIPFALSAEVKLKGKINHDSQLHGLLKLGGNFFLYHWQGELTAPSRLSLNGVLKQGHELHTQAQWQEFIWPIDKENKLASSKGQITADGFIPNITIGFYSNTTSPLQSEIAVKAQTLAQGVTAAGTVKLSEANLNFNFNFDNAISPKIKGNLHAESTHSQELHPTLKDLKFDTQFAGDSLLGLVLDTHLNARYFDNPLLANINYQQQHLKGRVSLGSNQLEINGTLPYRWQAKATIPKPAILYPSLAGLDTLITADLTLSNAMKGKANLLIKPGQYQLEEENTSRLKFAGGQLHASLTPEDLVLNGLLTIDKDKSLTLAFKLPHLQLQKGLANQDIQGGLRFDVNSLNFLQSFSPEISKPEGQLSAILQTKGTIAKPIVEGNITLKKGQVSLTNWGLDFHNIQFEMQSRNKEWQAHGSLASNNDTLALEGQGIFAPQITGLIHLDGNNFTLLNTPEYLVHISPKLLVEFNPTAVTVKGTIVIPKAQIKPQSFTNSVSLSEDVVFEGNERPVNPLHVNTDVRLEMGDDVSLDVKGLKGFLTGAIRIHQLPQEPLNATGELNVKDGKYQAYGQDLAIEQGQLLFTGGSVLNPGIRVRAVRQFKNATNSFAGSNQLLDFNNANLQTLDFGTKTTVGIDVTGRLTAPKVELFSIPSTLSQADILSMLLLGRPARQANKAGGQLLLAAISSMNLGSGANGTQLVEQLKQTLGVDVGMETTPKFDEKSNQITDQTSVVVGKSLSKRLYVSYNYGLAKTDSNVVTLTYLLNKFFSVQVNSSLAGSGIDLLYTHRKE